MKKPGIKLLISSHPKIFLIPFIALVLFFSILLFLVLMAIVHFIGFSLLEVEYSFYRDMALYLWIVSSIIAVPIALYYLNRMCGKCRLEKKPKKRKKEEIRASSLFSLFLIGLPFGYYINSFILIPQSIFFTKYQFLLILGPPMFFSLFCFFFLRRLGNKG